MLKEHGQDCMMHSRAILHIIQNHTTIAVQCFYGGCHNNNIIAAITSADNNFKLS